MKLYMQDSTFVDSHTLHEALLNACQNSVRGGGAYAFVTSGGVKLLLEDNLYLDFLKKSNFQLIIGTDAITNEKALERLNQLSTIYPKLNIKAFSHNGNTTFHPKYSWFKKENGGIIVLGSGNLTEMGLRRNWEAFTISEVSEEKILEIESQWINWLKHNENYLKLITDPEIIEKAKNNKQISRKIKKEISPTFDTFPETNLLSEEDEELEAWQYEETNQVLIAEIPRASSRWNQANFDKNSFVKFFGATPGDNSLRVLLRKVNDDGSLNDIENRPSVTVKSHNWRFELDAASGLNYPESGRPIGVFARISNRMFLYILSMPGNSEYQEILTYLNTIDTSGKDVRRCNTDVANLKANCPNLPFWIERYN